SGAARDAAGTVPDALAPGESVPGAGLAEATYWAAPTPETAPSDHVMSPFPPFVTVIVCGAGPLPPQVAAKESDAGMTTGTAPLAPDNGIAAGTGGQGT